MVFVETSLFSKLLSDYLRDDDYRQLQNHLIAQPDAGAVIRAAGGVRKVRWRAGGKGKSGGVSYLLLGYGRRTDLLPDALRKGRKGGSEFG